MQIEPFYDDRTSTVTYVVYDPKTRDAVVIDPVLDYAPVGSKVFHDSVDAVTAFIEAERLTLHYVLETHAHADHLSAAQVLKGRFPSAKTAIGARITAVQGVFKGVFDLGDDFATDGSQFDRLLQDGDQVEAGALTIEALHTPGHTPACMSYRVDDAVFTGDVLFMPDQGTGRCDFPAGSAGDMYRSVRERLYTLPDETRLFVGHDYQPDGRELRYETTVGASKAENIQLPGDRTFDDFVSARRARDAGLAAPKLLFPSVQVNIDAGRLPTAADNGTSYLKIPLKVLPSDRDE